MKFRSLVIISLLAALSGGCSTVRIVDLGGGQNYYDGAFEFATKDGKINTHVVGSPFSAAAGNFKNTVTSMMYGSTFGRNVKFVSSPPNTEKYRFHVVVTFNVTRSINMADLCENPTRLKSDPTRKTTSMEAIFCQGGYPLSYASGYVSGLTGPSDPRFAQLVREVTLSMIPRYDDTRSSGYSPF